MAGDRKDASDPAATFEAHRRRLRGLAYRMLGSMAEAEDAVQEAYLRWHAADRARVADPRAFLTTTTARICLDVLRSARVRREQYVGPWLPEPVLDTAALAPDTHAELADDLSIALLLTLERLSPLERAAFLLRDVFDCSFSEIAAALGRSVAACRQLVARARAHVRTARPLRAPSTGGAGPLHPKHERLVLAFLHATRSGDLDGLKRLLARDARVVTDGGGKVAAALNVIAGDDRAARFVIGASQKGIAASATARIVTVNGLPGVIVEWPGGVIQTVAFELGDDDLIRAVYVVRNPDKLRHVKAHVTETSGLTQV